ncbi:Hypothetical predicted protein [Mytilus galloprovincialis]|uniref:Fibronectin type-III domain-containing protein n=1 Tax=Mytilus galloprovincialis TaxID=29158 RepID=A0A8B6EU09_MYTGA|nr:Hypothetical predicted protein [Mytilus galloprovincialis]
MSTDYSDRPSIPENIRITELATGCIVRWTSGYNGGFQQSFFIQYRLRNTNIWSSIGPFNDTINNFYQVDGLDPNYGYELRMFSRNHYGSSNVTEIYEVKTLGFSTNQQGVFFLALTTGGGFLLICTLTVLFVHIYKQCNKTPTNQVTDNNHMHIYDEIDELTLREDLNVESGMSMISPQVIVNTVTAFNSDNDSETRTKSGEVDKKSSIVIAITMNASGSDSYSETSSKSGHGGVIEKNMSRDDEYLNPYQTLMKEFTQQNTTNMDVLIKSKCAIKTFERVTVKMTSMFVHIYLFVIYL